MISLSALVPLDVWNPFDLLFERDSSAGARPDIIQRSFPAAQMEVEAQDDMLVAISPARFGGSGTAARRKLEYRDLADQVLIAPRVLKIMNRTGTITAHPNPIRLAEQTVGAVTTLEWSSEGTETVELRVDAPDGPLLSRAGPSGSAITGDWVRDGMTFYLQDVSGGRPLVASNTLANVVVQVIPYSIAAQPPGQMIPGPMDREYSLPVGQVDLGDLRRLDPISRRWGVDRGRPIDRYYIENFLARQASDIRGHVLAVGDDGYTRRFGGAQVTRSDVLHVAAGPPVATITADLINAPHVPSETFDCIICPQTLQLIYELRSAMRTLHRILKPGGVLLVTLPGISHTRDAEWGELWCWHFTPRSARLLFAEEFGAAQIQVEAHGNVLAAIGFLHGLAVEEMRQEELDHRDPGYEVSITVRAVKPPKD